MEKQSIVINIFGRQFPVKVDREEAAVITDAAEVINNKLKAFKAQYKTQDDLDIAIMCCLDIMTASLKDQKRSEQEAQEALETLAHLEEKLSESMQLTD